MDFDNESLLRCFCSEEEEATIIAWNKENEHSRSDIFEYSPLGENLKKLQVEENGDQGAQWGKKVVFESEDGLPPKKKKRLKHDLFIKVGVLTQGTPVVVVFFWLSLIILHFVRS